MAEQPEKKRKNRAEDETGDDGEIKSRVFAAMDNVAGKFSQTKREFATEIEKCANENEEAAEEEEGAAEFAKRIHSKSLGAEEFPSQRGNAVKPEAARGERGDYPWKKSAKKPMAALVLFFLFTHLHGEVTLVTQLFDLMHLSFQPIDVALFILEKGDQKIA